MGRVRSRLNESTKKEGNCTMKNILWKSALLAIPLFGLAVNASAQASYDLRSPDKRIEVRIRTAQGFATMWS